MQQGYPPQQVTVIVPPAFGEKPAQVTCGNCRQTVVTTTTAENGACAYLACVIVLILWKGRDSSEGRHLLPPPRLRHRSHPMLPVLLRPPVYGFVQRRPSHLPWVWCPTGHIQEALRRFLATGNRQKIHQKS
ncbi:unnamed protein product [Larinioides sclopetarius]|uniref:LITAF domain-containing protein n=1 Tax=Larinioides sclopetarius TaxID=280406 RepID=A0AAV2BDA1_9ARAC